MIIIYCLFKNNIPFYIGKSKQLQNRTQKHKLFYGSDILIEIIDEVEVGDWKFWEKYYISLYKSWGLILENKNDGGGGPTQYTELQKQSMRKPRKVGTGEKISKSLLCGNHSHYYTKEIRDKMKLKLKGSHGGPFSDKHIDNIKNSKRKFSKRLLQYDLNGLYLREWKSKGEVVELINVNEPRSIGQNVASQIKDCCIGKMISCWGYIWRYKDEFIPIIFIYIPICNEYKIICSSYITIPQCSYIYIAS